LIGKATDPIEIFPTVLPVGLIGVQEAAEAEAVRVIVVTTATIVAVRIAKPFCENRLNILSTLSSESNYQGNWKK
jgi:hypothetical protein